MPCVLQIAPPYRLVTSAPQAFGSLGLLALILTSGFAIIRRELTVLFWVFA